ncbi:MBL fold metallo-hydrolase [Penaeicola halotolerans]|uniref:MBL fold metallo-hydrolase n=1 Tax=Penaeicola halotolerans TaxID=2793196 RepID=UPI001CF90277|nr:MBL fold metallo-hydrolase [Penaeicola halotolerans]
MKKYSFLLLLLLAVTISVAQDKISSSVGEITINPVTHGSFAMQWDDQSIFVDPYGGPEGFAKFGAPALVMITDIHGDHLDKKTLAGIDLSKATLVAPQAVVDQLGDIKFSQIITLNNGESKMWDKLEVAAIPMYNLPETEDSRHPKGRGNGYVITFGDKKFYISGDTEDIAEMRALRDIDVAFVCMNEPYTMNVDQAADAVIDFKPKVVYPYHYRGSGGLSDVDKFKSLVEAGATNVEVRLRKWY